MALSNAKWTEATEAAKAFVQAMSDDAVLNVADAQTFAPECVGSNCTGFTPAMKTAYRETLIRPISAIRHAASPSASTRGGAITTSRSFGQPSTVPIPVGSGHSARPLRGTGTRTMACGIRAVRLTRGNRNGLSCAVLVQPIPRIVQPCSASSDRRRDFRGFRLARMWHLSSLYPNQFGLLRRGR